MSGVFPYCMLACDVVGASVVSRNVTKCDGEVWYGTGLTGSVLVQMFCRASSLGMVLGNTTAVERSQISTFCGLNGSIVRTSS
jgi:hypothetical protein